MREKKRSPHKCPVRPSFLPQTWQRHHNPLHYSDKDSFQWPYNQVIMVTHDDSTFNDKIKFLHE